MKTPSHPSRVRGLKLIIDITDHGTPFVAPFTGAWIEILMVLVAWHSVSVAPFTGAWIEMPHVKDGDKRYIRVAPFTGAWIEIAMDRKTPLC